MSREFEAFSIENGIQRQHTVRNHPQQNGVAERSNRMMEEGLVSMLYESGMSTAFWGGSSFRLEGYLVVPDEVHCVLLNAHSEMAMESEV